MRLQGPKAAQMLNFPISDYAAELEAFREAGPQQLPSASRPSKRPRGDENLRDGPRKSIRRQVRSLLQSLGT